MLTRPWLALGGAALLLLAACNDDEPQAINTPTPVPTATATASAPQCLRFDGPPDGSAKHPYLKRAMALTCREDVKLVQESLGIAADGLYDNDTAAAVIAKQRPYACIRADDGQVGPQTWTLIVDGTEPCKPGRSATPTPVWANCDSGHAVWALLAADSTVLRRCAGSLELVRGGRTSVGGIEELGSSVCGDFDENFDAPEGTRTTLCVSNPGTDDMLQASTTTGSGAPIWSAEVVARYVRS
ncbi:MAG TPA: peptidoglycan-binding domain-containing protein [Sporichthya sp.]|nr:peptidoglycan-binding domain-containing protein [Sporichthya sp.]